MKLRTSMRQKTGSGAGASVSAAAHAEHDAEHGEQRPEGVVLQAQPGGFDVVD